jgi:thiol-disulfide isomerase/thioredoxin
MTFNGSKIIFLELSDFQNNILSYGGKPAKGRWFVMVQGSFCGYCTQAKPAFIAAANKYGSDTIGEGVIFATIQIDGSEGEKILGKKLPDITRVPMNGVPCYLLFEDGKFAGMHTGGRGEGELVEFLSK